MTQNTDMRNNQKGFSAVETILALTVIILIAVVGWLVYKVDHKTSGKTSSSSVTTTTTNPYAGWKTYSDSNFSFRYPTTWKVVAPGDRFNSLVDIDGPTADASYYSLGSNALSKPHLNLSLFNSLAQPTDCVKVFSCGIEALTPLTTAGIASPVLATISTISNTPPGDNSALIEVLNSSSLKVGDTSFNEGFSIKGNTYQFTGGVVYTAGNSASADMAEAAINNFTAFQQSTDYKNLVKIANSITVK